MPSSYSPNLRLELQATGENRSTWGTKANNDFSLIEQAITGYTSVAMADANVTLTTVNGATDQARNAIINLTGVNTAIRTVTIPSVSKVYLFKNSTTGGFAVNIKTAAGSTYVLAAGTTRVVYCDGTNTFAAFSTVGVSEGGTGATTASDARTNLGLGTSATVNTGTSGATIPLLNGNNVWSGTAQFDGNMTSNDGISFGSEVAGSVTDLSRHIALYSTTFGFNVTGSRLNYNVPSGSEHHILINGAEIAEFNSAGFLLGTNMQIAFQGTGASLTRASLGLGGLSIMDLNDLYYTGSSSGNLSFPITSYLFVRTEGGTPNRNASQTIYLRDDASTRYTNDSGASGGTVTGTWRSRGYDATNGYAIFQRTA